MRRSVSLPLQQDGSAGLDVPSTVPELLDLLSGVLSAAAAFLVTFVAVYLIGTRVLVPLVKRALDTRGFNESIQSLADSVVGAIVLFGAVAVAFTVAGFGSVLAAAATIGGALALAVGIAAQGLVGNFVAGIFILKDRPFEIGDWIEQGDLAGRVEDIDLRVTTLRTFDNEKVTVPNSELADNAVTNPVAYDKLRQRFVFGIGYDDDIDRAEAVILDEAAAIDAIMEDPAPDVRVTELADSYVGLQTRFWVEDPSRADVVEVQSDLVRAVKDRCDAEAIEMPFPYRELVGGIDVDLADVQQSTQEQAATDD
jgi:small-conductance mechanosensitive channel